MGVAFELEVTRSVRVARMAGLASAVPAVGLALAAVQAISGPTLLLDAVHGPRWLATFACATGAAAFALLAWRAWRGGEPVGAIGGALAVDDTGSATLRASPGGPTTPVTVRASCDLPGLTLLVLAPYLPQLQPGRRGRAVTVLLGRDAMPDDTWRRLHVWLLWMERGRPDSPAPAPDRP